ncbi:predicted protein [Uncinocarpus reesii 1704]|uniref:Transcriptional coactivator p15 (PC4) C-terminal domain-containing protein n=1 Tax=Uncinocarpus reesii (strain UAMH 1704) TaxID=336963 RepID=C4JEZ3_UNCRE|nr:uncharacterized protein UREG_00894 [Uncinocarpus reesii 1704]EEP76046.1 predicted protein [Uncinocarpus reesii 1704]
MATRKRSSSQQETTLGDHSSDDRHQRKKIKPTGQSSKSIEPKTDSNGDPYWEISRQRRVTVSSFKGRTMINVREYYEKGGQDLPGKKGISMTLEQFNALVALLPNLEEVVKQKGGTITRPEYGDEGDNDADEADQEMEEEEGQATKRNKVSPEKNIEATSDESEEED